MISTLYAFLKRDVIEQASYKFSFVSSIFSILLSSATFFFVSKLINNPGQGVLAKYGGDYFGFVIIGIAFSGILSIFQSGISGIIRTAQVAGTLEAIMVTRTSIPVILVGSSLYSFFHSFLSTSIHLILAVALFGMKLGSINWPGTILLLIMTSLCFLSIGIISASFVLVYKKGNPLDWIFGGISSLLGGVVFPIELLPAGLKKISLLLPITHSLDGLRRGILTSAKFSELAPNILVLSIFVIVLMPASLFLFRVAIRKAKMDGSLTYY